MGSIPLTKSNGSDVSVSPEVFSDMEDNAICFMILPLNRYFLS